MNEATRDFLSKNSVSAILKWFPESEWMRWRPKGETVISKAAKRNAFSFPVTNSTLYLSIQRREILRGSANAEQHFLSIAHDRRMVDSPWKK